MSIELLTARELTAKYPVSDYDEGNYRTWLCVLEKFRDAGKLEQGRHWHYKSVGNCQPARAYIESKVLRLCLAMYRAPRPAPFYSILIDKHGATIASVIKAASVAITPITPNSE